MSKDDQLISVPAQVIDLKPRQDRSWVLKFETRELSGDEVKILADNFQGEGWLVFKANGDDVTMSEIPQGRADAGTKSQAQRLRGSIMVLWRQKGSKGDPEAFYRTVMEKLIEHVKSQLEPE